MNKEDYEKIKESLKNTGVINELERVYNKEFVKDMVDYYEQNKNTYSKKINRKKK